MHLNLSPSTPIVYNQKICYFKASCPVIGVFFSLFLLFFLFFFYPQENFAEYISLCTEREILRGLAAAAMREYFVFNFATVCTIYGGKWNFLCISKLQRKGGEGDVGRGSLCRFKLFQKKTSLTLLS